jgi:hypothetical protein
VLGGTRYAIAWLVAPLDDAYKLAMAALLASALYAALAIAWRGGAGS